MSSRFWFVILAFSAQITWGQEEAGVEAEFFIWQTGVGSSETIIHTITAQGTYWGEAYAVSNDEELGQSAISITGNNVQFGNGWSFVTNPASALPEFGYALYKFTNDHTVKYFYVDFRDCRHMDAAGTWDNDILILYDAETETLKWCNCNPDPCNLTTITHGSTLTIWALKGFAGPETGAFQPTTPVNLTLTNSGGHPKLTWRKSDPRASAKYKVYRGSTLITPTAISDTSYTDTQVSIGGGSTIYYKVRAVSGDGSKESPDYSNTVSTSGVYEDRPADLADVAHRRYRLDTSYPNPFNPSTTLCYTLPDRSQVTLLVFNTLGQRVATLVEGEVDAGSYEAIFDAGGLPSGVYIARLIAGGTVQTTRMQLVR